MIYRDIIGMFPSFYYFSSKYSIRLHTYLCGKNKDAYQCLFFTMYTHFNEVLKMTALQNANKENIDSLDISSLIQFEEPWSTVFILLSAIVIQI